MELVVNNTDHAGHANGSNHGNDAGQADTTGIVDVLTSPAMTRPVGYKFVGNTAGARVLVAGFGATVEQLYERLAYLPNLSRLQGELHLITLEAVDQLPPDELRRIAPDNGFADILYLSAGAPGQSSELSRRQNTRATLRFCLNNGLFTRRGEKQA